MYNLVSLYSSHFRGPSMCIVQLQKSIAHLEYEKRILKPISFRFCKRKIRKDLFLHLLWKQGFEILKVFFFLKTLKEDDGDGGQLVNSFIPMHHHCRFLYRLLSNKIIVFQISQEFLSLCHLFLRVLSN